MPPSATPAAPPSGGRDAEVCVGQPDDLHGVSPAGSGQMKPPLPGGGLGRELPADMAAEMHLHGDTSASAMKADYR